MQKWFPIGLCITAVAAGIGWKFMLVDYSSSGDESYIMFPGEPGLPRQVLSPPEPAFVWTEDFLMQMVVSLILLVAALYVVLSRKYPTDSQKWAFGTLGTIVGFWLGG